MSNPATTTTLIVSLILCPVCRTGFAEAMRLDMEDSEAGYELVHLPLWGDNHRQFDRVKLWNRWGIVRIAAAADNFGISTARFIGDCRPVG